MVNPDYPIEAMLKNVQGEAKVDVLIGPDGRVLAATGTGTDPALVGAAERNVREWVFGPFPPHCRFPVEHQIVYKFTLQGKAKYIGIQPRIITDLPNKVEIVASPMASDGPLLIQKNAPK